MSCQARHTVLSSVTLTAILMVFTLNAFAAVDAEAAKALAKKSNCLTCHGIDKEKVGPALNKIAAKYRGDAAADEKLVKHLTVAHKVKFPGGQEMDHAIIKNAESADVKNLVGWILAQ